jgi:hypothetical protein
MDYDTKNTRSENPKTDTGIDFVGEAPKLPTHQNFQLPPPESALPPANFKDIHEHSRHRKPVSLDSAIERWKVRRSSMFGDTNTDATAKGPTDANKEVLPLPLHSSASTLPSSLNIQNGSSHTASDHEIIAATQQSKKSHSDNEDSESIVSVHSDEEDEHSTDSDEESSNSEFGNRNNPKMSETTRAGLETLIFVGKENTTLKYKDAWEKAKKREDAQAKGCRIEKYLLDFAAGSANQLTSFAVGGAAVAFSGNPWLFPVVATAASDLIGERLAQLIRRSTIVTNGTRQYFENHRLLARGLGDLISGCCEPHPKAKFDVITGKDAAGNPVKQKMTASEALRHTGCANGLSAWGTNLLVRGLPFLWFSGIYIGRDYYINDHCSDFFYPSATNATMSDSINLTSHGSDGCPIQGLDPVALRWGMILLGGMLAGGVTSVTSQLIASCLPGDERTNYGAETWKLQSRYLEAARTDTKQFLDNLVVKEFVKKLDMDDDQIADLAKAAETLKRIQEKELSVARKKSSTWTTFQAELDLATQKHRDETMITPEFGGKRLDLFLSMLGKFLSLLAYAYMLSSHDVRKATDEREKLEAVMLINFSLILMGYVWRDDLRLVGQLPYGAVKGAIRGARACTQKPSDDITTSTGLLHSQDEKEDGPRSNDRHQIDGTNDRENEKELENDGESEVLV